MTIIDKIKTSVEGATGLPFLYHAAGEINELVARANSLPISFAFLLDSGTIEDVNGRYHERITLAVMFTDKTEFDFNALENEEIIDRMKVKAYKWLDSLRNSNDLQIVSVNSTQRLYDTTTDILTGYAVNITLQDMQGVGECELPDVVIPITENGIYNVVGADKVDVKLFVTLKDLYVSRNGVYNPQDFGAYGFGSVNVNVRGEEDLEPAYDLLKNRVKGSEDGTIPAILLKEPFNATNLVENLSVLDNRRITNGDDMPDGLSLARVLWDSSINISSIIDDNVGWVLNHLSGSTQFRLDRFPNIKKISLGCVEINNRASYQYPLITSSSLEEISFPLLELITEGDRGCLYRCPSLTKVSFPKLHTLYSGWNNNHNQDGILVECNAIKSVTLPSLKRFENKLTNGNYNCIMYYNAALEELIMPNLQELYCTSLYYYHTYCVSRCPSIKKIVLGSLSEFQNVFIVDDQCKELLHIEFGQDTNTPIYLNHWNPTDKGEVFLFNFQTYIADRVADRVEQSALTLTLSADVYAALEAQEGQTILATLTNKNWNVAQA